MQMILLLMFAQSTASMPSAASSAIELMAAAKMRTTANVRCAATDTTAITVCGRRNADRYRAPLVTHVANRRDDVVAERTALLHRTTPVQDLSPFLVESGMAGASAGVSFGASGIATSVRPIAP